MANFDPNNLGTWFYFDDEDEEYGGVCLRVLPPSESAKINSKITHKKDKFKSGVHFVEEITDDKLAARLMWDYIIVDWKNVCIDDKEIECNLENKLKLIDDPNFSNFVIKSTEALRENIDSGNNLAKN